jgi:hypothetical protein
MCMCLAKELKSIYGLTYYRRCLCTVIYLYVCYDIIQAGQTPLQMAKDEKYSKIVRLLSELR